MKYFHRGRHRRPTHTTRNVTRAAVLGAVVAGGVSTPLVAFADTLDVIAACESGNDPTAQNAVSSASGLYQMIDSTWQAYGGSTAHARQASVAEQHAVAARLLAAEGVLPWDASRSCWAGKVGQAAPPPRAPQRAVQGAQGDPVTIRAGDTLSEIGARRGATWQALWQVNRATVADPDLIYPGQRLKLA